jgi:hypothetical protein
MKTSVLSQGLSAVAACLLGVAMVGSAQAGPLGYSLTGTTHYTAGCGAGTATIGSCGGPDTGWLEIRNTGASAFVGSATLSGVAPSQTINLSLSGVLNPGETWVFNAGPESSNQGGFNAQGAGLPDLGLLFDMNGSLDGGAFLASIYDSDIHSGVFATNPFGISLDNYVLQGGDPFGRDTGDGFEEAQAVGTFVWAARATGGVPEPGSLALLLGSLVACGAARRRRA